MSIPLRIKIAREDAKMTQTEFADAIGIGDSSMKRYEINEKDAVGMSVKTLIKISAESGKDISWLIHGEETEEKMDSRIANLSRKLKIQDKETIDEIIALAETVLLKNNAKKMLA